jgi:porin
MKEYTVAVLGVVVWLVSLNSWAATSESSLNTESSRPSHAHGEHHSMWEQDNLTGDWNGLRSQWAEKGVEFTGIYIGESLSTLSGGLRRGTAYQGLLDLGLDLDLEKLIDWKGSLLHANSYWTHGPSPTAKYIGDLQTVSNIDAFDTIRLNELWFQQSFLEDRVSLRVGQLAVDKEFIGSDYGSLFLNAGFGWPPFIGNNMSTAAFPLGGPGIRVRTDPSESFYFQAGVYDGDPTPQRLNESGTHFNLHKSDGFFSIYEVGYKLNQTKTAKGLPGTYKLGFWHHTDSFADTLRDDTGLSLADPNTSGTAITHDGNSGIYGVVDQLVYRESSSTDNLIQGLGVFFRSGTAPSNRNLIALHLMAGVHYTGLFPTRDEDQIGLGVTHVDIGEQTIQLDRDTNTFNATDAPIREYETALELTYRCVITPWWSVQPDFQYVLNPGGSSAIGDAFVAGVRFNLIF